MAYPKNLTDREITALSYLFNLTERNGPLSFNSLAELKEASGGGWITPHSVKSLVERKLIDESKEGKTTTLMLNERGLKLLELLTV